MNALLTFLFIGTTEIVFIFFIVVLVFGADKLPEIARGLGKGMRTIRDATNDIKHEVTKTTSDYNIIDSETTKPITDEINQIKDEVEDFSGSIKRES